MEIVINIPNETYKYSKKYCRPNDERAFVSMIITAIAKGVPLPKGHGKLIDVNEITAFSELECNGHDVKSLDEFTTIIEADKESE